MPNSPTATQEGAEERAYPVRERALHVVRSSADDSGDYELRIRDRATLISFPVGDDHLRAHQLAEALNLVVAHHVDAAMTAFAQSERVADGWQDIATAPRDGYFLAWGPHHPELAFPYEAERFWKARDPGFPGHLSSKAFTLWHRMPLPEPPATAIRSADQ